MTRTVDVAIIGAGTAGLSALREVKKATDNFVIINDGPYGTTCARVGCMPSKALIEATRAYHRRVHFDDFGISGAEGLAISIPKVFERVRRLRDDFVNGTLRATDALGEKNIPGRARLTGPGKLEVNGELIEAAQIILATGSRPVMPEPWRGLKNVYTSDTLFEVPDLPRRMAVIGMGVIGAELGQALARLGIEVHGFGASEWIAGTTDPVICEEAKNSLSDDMTLYLGHRAEVEARGEGLVVHAADQSIEVDAVLAALGRRPNLEELGLETLGVTLDKKGLPPYDAETLQIGDLPVFIAGDLNGRAPILHEAADDGHIAGRNATASSPTCYQRRPAMEIVFTDPDIVRVGKRYSECDPEKTVVGAVSFAKQGRARTANKNRGAIRVYADRESGRLRGAEMCVAEAEHMAHFLALALTQELKVWEVLSCPIYHPVLEEGLRTAVRRSARELPNAPSSDLASCQDTAIENLE